MVLMGTWSGVQSETKQMQLTAPAPRPRYRNRRRRRVLATLPCSAGKTRSQFYGEQLECAKGNALKAAPIDEEANVNIRRAELGLIRIELYARLVRLNSPAVCGPVKS
jgi:hypothetical protein